MKKSNVFCVEIMWKYVIKSFTGENFTHMPTFIRLFYTKAIHIMT